MLDVEKFLIALRSHKDPDGLLKPIFLADTVQEEIKIIQAAVENSRREWVGLTDEEKKNFVVAYYPSEWDRKTAVKLMNEYEAYLKEKNHG